jgi:hypothetical protein
MIKIKNIYYLGFYSGMGNPNSFLVFPASNNKMNYIISVIERLDYNLTVYSLGVTFINKLQLIKENKIKSNNGTDYIFSSTIGSKNILGNVFSKIWLYFSAIFFIISNINKDDVVIVYHSIYLSKVVKLCNLFIRFKLIYEIEEIYNAARQNNISKINKEISSIRGADGYILVNDLLHHKLNLHPKPYAVCYGNYERKYERKFATENLKINIVYAGFIGNNNSDVWLALQTIDILPEDYFLSVLGYGSTNDINELKIKIANINKKFKVDKVKYCGYLSGEEYENFLAKCDIGLSTRVLIDCYSDYTFPSKILVYLANSLIPVSPRLSCISESRIADRIVFYSDSNPQSVVDAILNIDFSDICSSNIDLISKLDTEFLDDLKHMLSNDTN